MWRDVGCCSRGALLESAFVGITWVEVERKCDWRVGIDGHDGEEQVYRLSEQCSKGFQERER